MKKKFELPELMIISFEEEDIITASKEGYSNGDIPGFEDGE